MDDTLFSQWLSYEGAVVPANAPNIQREECRRAFYAGAASMFGLTLQATVPQDEDVCERNLQALQDELDKFPSDLRIT
jgi:hypothetical protein